MQRGKRKRVQICVQKANTIPTTPQIYRSLLNFERVHSRTQFDLQHGSGTRTMSSSTSPSSVSPSLPRRSRRLKARYEAATSSAGPRIGTREDGSRSPPLAASRRPGRRGEGGSRLLSTAAKGGISVTNRSASISVATPAAARASGTDLESSGVLVGFRVARCFPIPIEEPPRKKKRRRRRRKRKKQEVLTECFLGTVIEYVANVESFGLYRVRYDDGDTVDHIVGETLEGVETYNKQRALRLEDRRRRQKLRSAEGSLAVRGLPLRPLRTTANNQEAEAAEVAGGSTFGAGDRCLLRTDNAELSPEVLQRVEAERQAYFRHWPSERPLEELPQPLAPPPPSVAVERRAPSARTRTNPAPPSAGTDERPGQGSTPSSQSQSTNSKGVLVGFRIARPFYHPVNNRVDLMLGEVTGFKISTRVYSVVYDDGYSEELSVADTCVGVNEFNVQASLRSDEWWGDQQPRSSTGSYNVFAARTYEVEVIQKLVKKKYWCGKHHVKPRPGFIEVIGTAVLAEIRTCSSTWKVTLQAGDCKLSVRYNAKLSSDKTSQLNEEMR